MNKVLTKGKYDIDTASFAENHLHCFCDNYLLMSTVQQRSLPLSRQSFISGRRKRHGSCGISQFSRPSWGGPTVSWQLPVSGENQDATLRCPGMEASL